MVIDYEDRPDHRRSWLLISLVVAAVRGVIADNLITHPNGFRAINDEEFGDWVLRHGGHPMYSIQPSYVDFTTWCSATSAVIRSGPRWLPA